MINQAVAKRYGKALLQIALENNALDAYQQDLETVVQTIEESHDLDAIWLGKEFDNETRKKVVKELFDGKVNQNIVNLLCVIVDKGREPFVRDVLEMYKKYADENGISPAQAKKKLTAAEQRQHAKDIDDYIAKAKTGDARYEQELRRRYITSRVSRLRALQDQAAVQLELLGFLL